MGIPAFVDVGAQGGGTTSPNNVPYPAAAVLANDVGLTSCFSSGTNGFTSSTWNSTSLVNGTSANANVLNKRLAGGESPGTISVANSGSVLKTYLMLLYRGVIPSGSFIESIVTNSGTGGDIVCPDITTLGANRKAIYFTMRDRYAGTIPAQPAGFTDRVRNTDTTSTDSTTHIFDVDVPVQGTVTGPTLGYGADGNEWFVIGFALIGVPDSGLEAAAQDVATATAGLNTSIKLGANAADAVSVSAALATSIDLAMAAVVNASATGLLSTQIRLGANAQAQATAVGTFGGAVLQAAATDVATAVAALTTAIRLGGAGVGHVSAAGSLTNWATVTLAGVLYTGAGSVLDPEFWLDDVPQLGTTIYFDPTNIDIAPNGEISASANPCTAVAQFLGPNGWAVGIIVITPNMVGVARAQASASAQLTTAIQLAAAANALSTVAANLSTGAGISAAAVDQASMSASLVTAIPLSALLTSVSAATAALTAQIEMAAGATAQATATANLNGVITINAAGQAVASMIANLSTQILLSGHAQDSAIASAAFTSQVRLDATAQAIVSAAGNLATAVQLGGSANDVASASGNLTTARPLVAAAIDAATAIATLSTGINLRANAAAIAKASAVLDAGLALLADARSEATATAELTDVIAAPPIGAYEIDPAYVVKKPRWSFLPLLLFTPRFSRKDEDEEVVLTFDLTSALEANERLQGPITITIRSVAGSDAAPQTLQRDVPSYDLTRKKIMLPVAGGIGGNWYLIKVHAATTNPRKTVSLSGLLPVTE